MTSIQVVSLGGGGFSTEPDNPLLDDFVLSLVPHDRRPRVGFVPTASGDAESYVALFHEVLGSRVETSVVSLFRRDTNDLATEIAGLDVLYVGGGSTANLLAVWRLHGLDRILLRAAAGEGLVLAGISAGMNCWFESSLTDSFGPVLTPLGDGLGLVPGSACPHYDGEEDRRPAYLEAVATGSLPGGHAADDGTALHFVDGELVEAVSSRRSARAFRVERRGDDAVETPIGVRYLGAAG